MNKTVFLLMMLFSLTHASVIYNVDVDRSGFASIIVSMEGEDSTEILIPDDAQNFRIVGGAYSIENNTAIVESLGIGFTTFSYSTSALTQKTSTGWKLSLSPPPGSETVVYLPPYTSLENSYPQPVRISAEDSRTLLEMGYPGSVSVYYSLDTVPEKKEEGLFDSYVIIILAILAGILAREIYVRMKPRKLVVKDVEKKTTFDMTAGKKEMMETFNDNDLSIVNFLLANKGKSRRNLLERKTGISKSSLSKALNRLEKRKIIEMDRTSTTHFVKLSEYFLKL